MRQLAIECATEACSVALFENGECLAASHEILGRGHAERLVPMIADLPDKGRAQRIMVSLGPGSFTGLRIGLATARALGLAWGAQVQGYPTLALVAAMARGTHPGESVTVCMTGGHGEYFMQDFDSDGLPSEKLASLKPEGARCYGKSRIIAGSKANEMVASASGCRALDILPDARHVLLVPQELMTARLTPIYGRAPDARLPGAG